MDRQAWVAITVCVIGLIAWYAYTTSHLAPPQPAPVAASPTPGSSATASASPSPSASPAAAASPSATPAEIVQPFVEKTETLANGDVELRLTNRGGAITEAVLLNHTIDNGNRVALNAPDRTPIGAIVEQPEAISLPEFSMEKQPDGSVQFERKTTEGVTIRKRFFFLPATEKKDNFVAEMDVDFRNDSAQPYNNAGYFVTLGSTRPIHPKDLPAYTRLAWYANGKAGGIDVNWFGAQNYPIVGVQKRAAQPFYREKINNAEWAGMTNQFFTDLLTPLNAKGVELWAKPFDIKQPEGPSLLGIEGAMGLPGFQLEPGKTASVRFQLYTGPKIYGRLAKLEHNEAEIMDFGILKLVCQALLNFMNLLNAWVGNYGVAIVLMTVCVKGVLWPLQNKANRSMRKMSVLSPKMQELKEKYKDDPTRMNQEVMKLYKEYGVNPVGSCLPMMIQIPIFIGLFTMLRQVAELRNAKFLWVHDLSQPDTLFTIPGLSWIPILGNTTGLPINIFPILMGVTQFWLMRMTPKTGDSTQQKVMMFMPLIFLFFCYNFAAALALYYTTQNLLSILQFWHNQRQPAPVVEKVAPAGKRDRKGRR
jgi:YidC/Oxa1 family membrane protein insertase